MTIRLLVIEDSENDYLLLLRQLKQEGIEPISVRVDSAVALEKALAGEWDIILSDFDMKGFDGFKALATIRSRGLDTPFILLSGTVGEEIAVDAMRLGAQDYIMKDSSTRLVPAMKRELTEAIRRKKDREAIEEREEQLRQAQKMEAIGLLASGLAHDFNNILGVIGLQVESIQDAAKNPEGVQSHAEGIMGALERANILVRKLLALGKKTMEEPRRIDLNALVASSESMLRLAVGTRNELVLQLDPGLPEIFADPVQIEQILMNLAVNARDAMPKGGKLTIRTAQGEELPGIAAPRPVLLSVIDTGCGMEAETKRKIFEPYFTTKGTGKGSGLGLYTVFGIMKQLGGDITVQSDLGVGTTFDLRLPPAP